jgi:hypothetical protein
VRQEWDKLADLLQEEQNKLKNEPKEDQTKVDNGQVKREAKEITSPKAIDDEEEMKEDEHTPSEATSHDGSPSTETQNALPGAADELAPLALEQLPYGYLELADDKDEDEDSEDEYVEAGAAPSAGGKGGKSAKGKGAKGRAKGKAKGKTAAKGQRKGRTSGGATKGATPKGTRKSARRSQQDELMTPMDDASVNASTTTSPSLTPPLFSPAPSSSGGISVAAAAQLRKLEELHRRECKNGRETGCEFCSILDCKWGNEDHYRKENEGGCPCRSTSPPELLDLFD